VTDQSDTLGFLAREGGPFVVVPRSVARLDISDGALRLYVMLADYANGEGRSWPSRGRLAADMRCSTDTVDRRVKELRDVGLLTVKGRTDGDRQTSNLWTVVTCHPQAARMRREGRTGAALGGRVDAAPGTRSIGTNSRDRKIAAGDGSGAAARSLPKGSEPPLPGPPNPLGTAVEIAADFETRLAADGGEPASRPDFDALRGRSPREGTRG
jgi:hypothetical protein